MKFSDFAAAPEVGLLQRRAQSASDAHCSDQQLAGVRASCPPSARGALHLRDLFNRAMDSWTVTSALLLAGAISSAAFSVFDTGESKVFLARGRVPTQCLFGAADGLFVPSEGQPRTRAGGSLTIVLEAVRLDLGTEHAS